MAKPLNMLSGMPQMSAAFMGWSKTITLKKRIQSVDSDGMVYDVNSTIVFKGTIQPLSPKTIALKPEGQRAFTWLQIHALVGTLNLTVNDEIIYNGTKYKVMAVLDYSLNGFYEYHACEAFQ